MSKRRVVVTGMGMVSPLGHSVEATWNRILKNESGIQSLSVQKPHYFASFYDKKWKMSFDGIPSQVAGMVSHAHLLDVSGYRDEKKLSPFMVYAMHAADQALNDAQYLPKTSHEKRRTGVCIGSGIGSLEDTIDAFLGLKENGYKSVSPFFVPKILINLAAGHISLKYGIQGPNHAVSTACTTGAHAIGDATRFIQYGDADVMIAGGTEASISPLSMAGFARAKSLSTQRQRPEDAEKASRPFDSDRDGFVISEGAGVLVLEEFEHARRRGARMYAEILGYGVSSDAHHYTAPPNDGDGAFRAMTNSLRHAGVDPADVDYINAHATSTLQGDLAEGRAIQRLLREAWKKRENIQDDVVVDDIVKTKGAMISSSKGHLGHLLGAAGSVETILSIQSIFHGVIPGTRNLERPASELDGLQLISHGETVSLNDSGKRRIAMCNSFGFGGTNSSITIGGV